MRIISALSISSVLILSACSSGSDAVFVTKMCSIDAPAKDAIIPTGQAFVVGGWAFDEKASVVPQKVSIKFVSQDRAIVKTAVARRGTRRQDVAQAFGIPSAVGSGLDADIPADLLPAGVYGVTVQQESGVGAIVLCESGNSVTIKGRQ